MILPRNGVNEIVPGKIYQRGAILTWPLATKLAVVTDLNIGLIVNFWPKLDPNIESLPCAYWHIPVEENRLMLQPWIVGLAQPALDFAGDAAILVLCEAGRGRSVFFSALLARYCAGPCGANLLEFIQSRVPGHSLKPELQTYLKEQLWS